MTKTDIVQAAFRVWGRGFYQTTSLTELARELGVSKPALYRHFPNKQALLDAMYNAFFDDYAAFVKDGFRRALEAQDETEMFLIVTKVLAEFYAGNPGSFVFSLVKVYGRRGPDGILEQLAARGVETPSEASEGFPSRRRVLIATVIFWLARFHKNLGSFENPPSDSQIRELADFLETKMAEGLGLDREQVDSINYEALEGLIREEPVEIAVRRASKADAFEDSGLLRAVAEVAACAGPWNASMDMVARRSGLSKSGLYAHFKSRKDMLTRFFQAELNRITSYTEANKRKSAVPGEQLYLAIGALAGYFRSYPELLQAMDWLRTRRMDLELPEQPGIFRLFADIDLPAFKGGSALDLSQWIIFLTVSACYKDGTSFTGVPAEAFRVLYRFITLGLRGFDQPENSIR